MLTFNAEPVGIIYKLETLTLVFMRLPMFPRTILDWKSTDPAAKIRGHQRVEECKVSGLVACMWAILFTKRETLDYLIIVTNSILAINTTYIELPGIEDWIMLVSSRLVCKTF